MLPRFMYHSHCTMSLATYKKKKKENNHRLPKSSIKLKTCAYTDTSCQTKTQLCVHVHCTRSSISHVGEMPFMESLSSSIWNIGHSCDTINILSRQVYSQVPHVQVSEITQWRIKRHFTHMSQVSSCYFKLVVFIKSLSRFFLHYDWITAVLHEINSHPIL